MPNYAILHADSRVCRRLTTEEPPTLKSDEIAVEVAADFDLAGGPWKVDVDGKQSLSTKDEADQAFILPHPPSLQSVIDSLEAIERDPTVLPSLKAFASSFRVMIDIKRDTRR